MTREQEIATLQSLNRDTYFAQYFGQDIDQMCRNIDNDFPIEMGCRFNEKAEEARSLKAELKETKETTVRKIIEYANPACDNELYHYCESLTSRLFVIETKRKAGLPLFQEEIDFLLRAAKQYFYECK